ncbi:MAG: hypothetical protein C4518_20145 [Desulfobacteraceae bacterium]|nr:MAG: hypothetical protein C4518_20145 [Desulfobacteraceae bacterium]
MASKIKNSAFFLSVIVSMIYVICWILPLSVFDASSAFSTTLTIPATAFQSFMGFLYVFVPFFFVFMLMKSQINHLVQVQAQLKTANDTLENRVTSRTAALEKSMSEIKTLKGMLTICANCKDIRNGQGKWETVESYIQRHSEVEFSHGLCKDCKEELYGENFSSFSTDQADWRKVGG